MSASETRLPEGWTWCALEDVADVRLGRQRSPKNHSGPNMVPYLRAANVTWAGFDLSDVKEMQFSEDEVNTYKLEPGDILVAEASGSASEVGKPAIWRGEIETVCFQNTLIRVRSKGPAPEYVLLVLREAALSGSLGRSAPGVGIHHLGAKRLSSWAIPIAPADDQLQIVQAVEENMAVVDLGRRELVEASERAQAYLTAVIRDVFAAFADAQTRPLGEVADIRSGLTKGRKTKGEVSEHPFLRAANVRAGVLDLDEIKTIPATQAEVERFRLEPGDVLMIEGSGSVGRLGQGWVWEGQVEGCLHQNHVFRARPNHAVIEPLFLAWFLISQQARSYFIRNAKTTAGLSSINRTQVAALPIPTPTLEEQLRAVATFEDASRLSADLKKAISAERLRADQLVRSLLHAACTGGLSPSGHASIVRNGKKPLAAAGVS
jgi:type I restriction enzyme, S subunit